MSAFDTLRTSLRLLLCVRSGHNSNLVSKANLSIILKGQDEYTYLVLARFNGGIMAARSDITTQVQLFPGLVETIERFYEESGYELGWRFLNCSKSVLSNDPKVAFITLNPGGKEIPKDHPWASCEEGSSYLNEIWGNAPEGKSNLQVQIQLMFAKLVEKTSYRGSHEELIEESLAGYFVPFRSPRLADLANKKLAFEFGNNLWSKVLSGVNPQYFVCIDRESYKRLIPLIEETYNLPVSSHKKLDTGWGNYTAEIVEFGEDAEKRLLRLPHLSTFKIFTSQKCAAKVDVLFTEFC